MRSIASAAAVCLSLGLVACEGTAAGNGCATSADIAHKVNVLTDQLNTAQAAGKIDPARAGEVAAAILEAGRAKTKGATCAALEKVRQSLPL